jgi:hypothetical protein
MHDYIMETIFELPMKPVADGLFLPSYQDAEGRVTRAQWVETDWEIFEVCCAI